MWFWIVQRLFEDEHGLPAFYPEKESGELQYIQYSLTHSCRLANGLAPLPPILAKRLTHNSTKFSRVSQRTHAEGSQVSQG